MIRTVLDPGVLVAALLSSRGAPAQLLRLLVKGGFQLVLSPKLLEETAEVLIPPHPGLRQGGGPGRDLRQV